MAILSGKKGDAGSEVSLQSCDQTQSRRTYNVALNPLKINEINLHPIIKPLGHLPTLAKFATVQLCPVVANSATTQIFANYLPTAKKDKKGGKK